MKKFILLPLMLIVCSVCAVAQTIDNDVVVGTNCIYVYLSDGGVDAYELQMLDGDTYVENDTLYVPLLEGNTICYTTADYDSCSNVRPQLPTMTTFKFNNKYNPNLFVDAVPDTVVPNMQFTLNCIGRWLSPSFNLSDDKAVAYVDSVMQVSKETRTNFANGATYVVTYPGYNKVSKVKVKDEVWSSPEEEIEQMNITPDMLSTNKPSAASGEGLENLLDGDPGTMFHSTWGDANNSTLYVSCFITIELPEAVNMFQFYYMTRAAQGYNPLELEIYASDDNQSWDLKHTLTAENDGFPRGGVSQEYTSPTIDLGASYRYLRIRQTRGEYSKNHMALAELRLYKVTPGTGESVKLEDAVYETRYMPFGNEYRIDIDWLATKAPGVPKVRIDVDGGYYQIHYDKDTYRTAQITIDGNGMYDDFEGLVNIKGRGNSTWNYPKKPYRLKFDSKQKPFGLTNGKSWVLLANYQTGSFFANAIAMKIGQLAQVPYTNHIVPVDLYMDGEYSGSYMFTEKVGFGNNSVDIDEDTGNCFMLELDEYYDETYKFKSSYYNLPVNVKEPDLSDYDYYTAQDKLSAIKSSFTQFEEALYYGESIEPYLDLETASRYMLANDIVLGQEIGHPKSSYLWREDVTSPDSKLILGPMWDYDWAFGYETKKDYCTVDHASSVFASSMYGQPGYNFYGAITRHPEFKRYYYKAWKEFVSKGHINELLDYIDDYYNFAKGSFSNDVSVWGSSYRYDQACTRTKEWLKKRHDYIMDNLAKEDITDILYTLRGDVDCNNLLTIHDVVIATDYMQGVTDPTFNFVKADVDGNNRVELSDVEDIASQVIVAEAVPSYYYYNTPVAQAILSLDDFEIVTDVSTTVELPLAMQSVGSDRYKAVQADIVLPLGMTLVDVAAGEIVEGHNFQTVQLDENYYRIMAYSDESDEFSTGEQLATLTLYCDEILPDEECKVELQNILTVNGSSIEQRMGDLTARFAFTTSIVELDASATVRGGDCITVTALMEQKFDIYSVDGRLMKSVEVPGGTSHIYLPAGVYVVMGKKVLVR